ncbi:MAG TPA: 2-succinyl-5-enolpyruvyl-6-hydroxy-3-cyclohexene-1-carboxylic-acid synthase [Gammaproteobacteria bacterium]|nr:2-succinyl-5-enolpyruvyl-6-hydroxy-3-cyclohexene-1-carboxylic-acid synthase [Gammaproteobacteria bacterium]
MSDTAARNLQRALALIDGMAAAGVQRAVVSPGSRSTPLALACELHPSIETRVLIDERCAAFHALGLARATDTPAILIATSGSAPTHWHPAVVEADQAMVPLLLLTADRPPRLQGCGANQTIDQTRLFGSATRAFLAPGLDDGDGDYLRALGVRAVHQSRWPLPGPVQLNLPFEEPLVPQRLPAPPQTPRPVAVEIPGLQAPDPQLERVAAILGRGPGLIVCGPGHFGADFAGTVSTLAGALECPLLADPLSGLRFGDHERRRVLARYDSFLRDPVFCRSHRPEWVLRFGAVPVSKPLQVWLEDLPAGRLLLTDPHGRWPDPGHGVGEMLRATPALLCRQLLARAPGAGPAGWLQDFLQAEAAAEQRMRNAVREDGWFEAQLVDDLLEQLPAGSQLFVGNSMPVRELDAFSGTRPKALRLFANRGTSGIDGHVSTLLGLARAAAPDTRTVGLIGDLAFCHDLNGLLAAPGCDATLVVINNGGGGIFRYLPQSGLETFERYWLTPTGLDFSHAARLYGVPFRRVEDAASFRAAFADSLRQPGVKLIEARIDPQRSLELHRACHPSL